VNAGPAWRWDTLKSFEVQLDYGVAEPRGERVLGGANAALIGDGSFSSRPLS
jgi:hypothetical protein